MISINEALNKVTETSFQLEKITINLADALGFVLNEDIKSPIQMPPFSQSAMDGYAICGLANSYTLIGEVQAGDTNTGRPLQNGEAVRIFTGAMIPEGTTAIAKQEIVNRNDNTITLLEDVPEGMSIRKKGEEIALNAIAMTKGTVINPAAIGFLSGLGIQKVSVIRKPKIGVIVTGNELVKPGTKLLPGQIYESNSATLSAVLKHAGFEPTVVSVKDDFTETKNTIDKTIKENDVVIITGGISVGDYDFVGKSLNELNVEEVFYKVKQKPGKPIFYGIKENKRIFGLPGNPAAVLTCFYMYVLPSIKTIMGNSNPILENTKIPLLHDFTKKGDRAHLLKGYVNSEGVKVHTGQSSAMLSSFVGANCLIYLSEEDREITVGTNVTIYKLPVE